MHVNTVSVTELKYTLFWLEDLHNIMYSTPVEELPDLKYAFKKISLAMFFNEI